MSTVHATEHWIDRNFSVLVILFGLIFVSVLVSFYPSL